MLTRINRRGDSDLDKTVWRNFWTKQKRETFRREMFETDFAIHRRDRFG